MGMGKEEKKLKLPLKRSFKYTEHMGLRVDKEVKAMKRELETRGVDTSEIARFAIREAFGAAVRELDVA